MRFYEECPELYGGQSAGRPIWQMDLSLQTLEIIDRMANAAYSSEQGMASYVEFTRAFRAALQEGKESVG